MDTKKKTTKVTKTKVSKKTKKSSDPFARSDDESGKSEEETLFKSGSEAESESESEEKVVLKKKIIKKKTIKKDDTIKEEEDETETKKKRESKFMYTQALHTRTRQDEMNLTKIIQFDRKFISKAISAGGIQGNILESQVNEKTINSEVEEAYPKEEFHNWHSYEKTTNEMEIVMNRIIQNRRKIENQVRKKITTE